MRTNKMFALRRPGSANASGKCVPVKPGSGPMKPMREGWRAAGARSNALCGVSISSTCRSRRSLRNLRSLRSRLAFWLFVGALFAVFGFFGAWPDGVARPLNPDSPPAQDWPIVALGVLAALSALLWLVPRERLLPRRPPDEEDELAGYTAALLALGVLSLVILALNPFALLFVLPSLHLWLWLPQLRDRPVWIRLAVLVAGLAGPALLVGSFAARLDLGLDTLWYLTTLVTVGYVDSLPVVVALACVAWVVTRSNEFRGVLRRRFLGIQRTKIGGLGG